MLDTKILDEIIIGRTEPHIYAFSTSTIPNYLKIGDTYRPVSVRLEEWKKHYPKLKKQFEKIAKINNDIYFRDYSVHKYLENNLNKKRLLAEQAKNLNCYYSNEFFENTLPDDISEALKDIANDYATSGNRYKFYDAKTSLPSTQKYTSSGLWKPRPNQEEAIKAFEKAVKNGRKNLLMYAVMRFGKSFTSMCCAEKIKAKFIVIVSAKADVKDEWKKTVEGAENFRNEYEFISTDDLKQNHSVVSSILSSGKKAVLFLTLYDLHGDIIKDKHRQVFSQEIDLLLIDETHFGARAEKLGQILKDSISKNERNSDDYVEIENANKQIKSLNAKIKLHLSGTPYRILMGSEFKKDDIIAFCQFSDIIDAQKKWDYEYLEKKNPQKPNALYEEWDNPYYGFPQMIRFAFNLNKSSRDKLKELEKNGVSFAFSKLFEPKSIKKNNILHNKFKHEGEILDFLKVIDGSKTDDELLGFLNYEKIKKGNMCKHIVMVLPFCASCDAMENLIKNNLNSFNNLKHYEILNISGHNRSYDKIENIKQKIKEFDKANKKTMTLTVNRMLTGSTVEEWDTMLFLKDTSSPQEYDQAIFRLQNQHIKTYTNKDDEIKCNEKPQTLLVDFLPERLFKMQEMKAQIYNLNTDKNGNSKLKDRLIKEVAISPIIAYNANKLVQVTAMDILSAISNYSNNRGIAEEVNEIAVDESLKNIQKIYEVISKENELGSKNGFFLNAAKGSEESDLDTDNLPDNKTENNPNLDNQTTANPNQDGDYVPDFKKQFRSYYARILFFAFLTKNTVISLQDILSSLNEDNNIRIFKNLNLNKDVLKTIEENINPYILKDLEYKIQNINELSKDKTNSPSKRAEIAVKKIGKISDSEIITPSDAAAKIINLLPDELFYKIAKSNNKKILDLSSKSGEFAIAVYNRCKELNIDTNLLKDKIYSIPTSSLTYEFTKKVYEDLGLDEKCIASKFNSYDLLNIKTKNIIDYEKISNFLKQNKEFNEISLFDDISKGGKTKVEFEAIVGNPPFQENISKTKENRSLSKQLFPYFMIGAFKMTEKYASLISPSKWFTGEAQDHSFVMLRKYLKENNHIKELHHFNKNFFDGVEIGSVNFLLFEKGYVGDVVFNNYNSKGDDDVKSRPLFENGLDIILSLNKMVSVINKVKNKADFVSFETITKGRNAFGITGKDEKNIPNIKNSSKTYKLRCAKEKIKNIDKKYILKEEKIADSWKVFMSKANGGAGLLNVDESVNILGKPYLGEPKMVCTDSLIPIGCFDNKAEAINLEKYIKTKFLRFLVGALKVSQNLYQNVYKLVPIQDFSNNSDINWNKSVSEINSQLYQKYNLTDEEINFIESMIKPME